MITTLRDSHNLPRQDYIKIYYTDDYTILHKTFSDIGSAEGFVEKLKTNRDFHFIEMRVVKERPLE